MPEIITLPKKLIKEKEFVLIPRSQYEKLLRILKEQEELDKGIKQSLKEVKQKKIVGPFEEVGKLMKSLLS